MDKQLCKYCKSTQYVRHYPNGRMHCMRCGNDLVKEAVDNICLNCIFGLQDDARADMAAELIWCSKHGMKINIESWCEKFDSRGA